MTIIATVKGEGDGIKDIIHPNLARTITSIMALVKLVPPNRRNKDILHVDYSKTNLHDKCILCDCIRAWAKKEGAYSCGKGLKINGNENHKRGHENKGGGETNNTVRAEKSIRGHTRTMVVKDATKLSIHLSIYHAPICGMTPPIYNLPLGKIGKYHK